MPLPRQAAPPPNVAAAAYYNGPRGLTADTDPSSLPSASCPQSQPSSSLLSRAVPLHGAAPPQRPPPPLQHPQQPPHHPGTGGGASTTPAVASSSPAAAASSWQGQQQERFIDKQKVGEGTYGVVYKCIDRTTGQYVALKKVRLETEEDGVPATAIREISLLREVRHPNVVSLLDVVCQEKKVQLVFEYVDQDLRSFLDAVHRRREHAWRHYYVHGPGMYASTHTSHQSGNPYGRVAAQQATPPPIPPLPANRGVLTPAQFKSIVYQLIQGVFACHSRRIVHRDLKPQNILISSDGARVKVADFGLARAFQVPLYTYTLEVITLWYRPPEILLGERRYRPAVDMWSLGCIMAELALGKVLFSGEAEIHQLFEIFQLLGTPTEATWPGIALLPNYCAEFPKFAPKDLALIMDVPPSPNASRGVSVGGGHSAASVAPADPAAFGGFGGAVSVMDAAALDLLQGMLTFDPAKRLSAHAALCHAWFDDIRQPQFASGAPNTSTGAQQPSGAAQKVNLSPTTTSTLDAAAQAALLSAAAGKDGSALSNATNRRPSTGVVQDGPSTAGGMGLARGEVRCAPAAADATTRDDDSRRHRRYENGNDRAVEVA